MTAPERIWVPSHWQQGFAEKQYPSAVEYVRADLADTATWNAAIRAAAKVVQKMDQTRTYTDEELGTMTGRTLVKPQRAVAAILALLKEEKK